MATTRTLAVTRSSPREVRDHVAPLPDLVAKIECHWTDLAKRGDQLRCNASKRTTYVLDDAIHWLAEAPECCIQAIVSDPPYALRRHDLYGR